MKTLFFTTFFIALQLSTFAQLQAVTQDGKTVSLNDNGTWEYKTITEKVANVSPDAYSCENVTSTTVDKMTGKATTGGKENIVISADNKEGIGIFVVQSDKSTIFSMKAISTGTGCIDDDAKINVLFRDGTKITLINDGDFACDGSVVLYFGGPFRKKKELEMFATKEVETMRVWGRNGFIEEDFSEDNSKTLLTTVRCLAKL